ncbi:MAG TPA: hypothetical protein PLY87_21715 [Planctomycetaceae bacterium]|nr:hypothetical protein [Planctomycetaceae bacterium]
MQTQNENASSPVEAVVMPVLHGDVRLVYEWGEPRGIRDDHGFICFFNPVAKFSGQEERYQRELDERRQTVEFILQALRSA